MVDSHNARSQPTDRYRRSHLHGLIFTSFRQFTWTHLGDHADAIWRGLPRYLATDVYPDEAMIELVERAAAATSQSRDEVLRRFGRYTGEIFFQLLRPEYYEEKAGTREFLLGIEDRIHEVLRTSIKGAVPPKLQVTPLGTDGVVVTYTSDRGLCALLEGLVHGTAAYYGEHFDTEQTTCMHRGDAACCFVVTPRA